MTGTDVWKWLVNVFDNNTIYSIYRSQKIVCKGFRTNTIQDIKANRNVLNINLHQKNNYSKLLSWSKDKTLNLLDGMTLVDKEVEELSSLAKEKGAPVVFTKLFSENQEEKAIRLFSLLRDENSDLLNVSHQSLTNNTLPSEKNCTTVQTTKLTREQEDRNLKQEEKKVRRLEEKIEKLNLELEKRENIHKKKIEQIEGKYTTTLSKLNEKNRLYGELLKEKDELLEKLEITQDQWDKEKKAYQEEKDELVSRYEEEEKKWNKEREEYEEFTKFLENENEQLSKTSEEKSQEKEIKEQINSFEEAMAINILVIGKPAFLKPFAFESVHFTFLEGNEVHNYVFPSDYDAYLVLSYELSHKEQFLLKINDFYSKLDEKKITICKDFNDVKIQLKKYEAMETGAI
ncbi:hypothetical protein ABEY51_11520 [Priestia megaterium]